MFEHEATTSKISEDQLFYCLQRGLSAEEAAALIVNGFVKDVLQQLPMEFAVEAQKLISISPRGQRSADPKSRLVRGACADRGARTGRGSRKWMSAPTSRRHWTRKRSHAAK